MCLYRYVILVPNDVYWLVRLRARLPMGNFSGSHGGKRWLALAFIAFRAVAFYLTLHLDF